MLTMSDYLKLDAMLVAARFERVYDPMVSTDQVTYLAADGAEQFMVIVTDTYTSLSAHDREVDERRDFGWESRTRYQAGRLQELLQAKLRGFGWAL